MHARRFSISVLQFDDLSGFFSAYYEFRKHRQTKFSYELWARQLGGMDRSLLRQVTSGERSLPQSWIEAVASYFTMDADEVRHFTDLVTLSGGVKSQKSLRQKVNQRVQYYRNLHVIKEVEKFLETPELPVLATLLTFDDLPKNVETLAKVMKVSKKLVADWFEVLNNLGFIVQNKSGEWSNTKNSFRIPTHLGADVILRFHADSLQRAIRSMSAPKNERHYEAMLLPLSAEEYKEYLVMMNNFREEVLGRFISSTIRERGLYQVNLAIAPVIRQSEWGQHALE